MFTNQSRCQMAITNQMIYARLAMDILQDQYRDALALHRQSKDTLAATEEAE